MLHRKLAETASAYPEKTALVYDTLRMSYRQLYAGAVGLGRGLAALDGPPGAIALLLPNCPEFIISVYAAATLGRVVVPINPALKPAEIRYYVDDCAATIIITNAQHIDTCLKVIAESGRPIALIVIDARHPSARNFHDLIQPDAADAPAGAPHEGDILYQFSSGSTGRPKRVNRTQRNLIAEARNFTTSAAVTAADTILCIVPLFHAHGLGNCLLAATTTGATLVILEPHMQNGVPVEVPFISRCARVARLIADEHVTILPGVPYIFSAFNELPADAPADLSSVRLCFSAGNFLPRPTFDAFLARFKLPIRQLYGCTEAGAVAINLDPDVATTWDSVGQPLDNVTISILDDSGAELPAGQVGEIRIKTGSLTDGYVGMPDLNAEVFHDGAFLTGDLGRKDQHGRLFITGRKKIFIDTGGYKVDPLEVEDVLITHPAVSEAVVVGITSPYGGEIVKAAIVPRGDCTEEQIIAHCRAQLADFKVPRIVEFIGEIPKSPLGKILRKNLVQESFTSAARPEQSHPIRQALRDAGSRKQVYALIENHLREQIRQTLKLDRAPIDPQRPLNDFGLTSVTAIELKVRLETTLAIPLSATLVWNYPTVASLAEYLAGLVGASRADAPPAQASELAADEAELAGLSDDEVRELLDYETSLALQDLDESPA